MSKRAHIPYPEQLAAALRDLWGIDYEHAKLMTAEQLISLGDRDHGIPVAIGGTDAHWNLTWRLREKHREKTAKHDIPAIAKSKRVQRAHTEHLARVSARAGEVEIEAGVEQHQRQPRSRWPKGRKLQSRPFPKKARNDAR